MPMLRDAVAREMAQPRPRWALLAIAHNAIASAYVQQGKGAASDTAFGLATAALQRDSARTGGDLGMLLINWGTSVGRRGEFARAAELKRRGVNIVMQTMGPTHYISAMAQTRLADELIHVGRLAEGLGLVDSALAVQEAAVPRSMGEISYSLRLRAAYQVAAGQTTEAARTIARARVLLDSVKANRPVLEANLLLVAADLHLANGDRSAARAELDRAATVAREKLGPKHLITMQTARRLAAFDSVGVSGAVHTASASHE